MILHQKAVNNSLKRKKPKEASFFLSSPLLEGRSFFFWPTKPSTKNNRLFLGEWGNEHPASASATKKKMVQNQNATDVRALTKSQKKKLRFFFYFDKFGGGSKFFKFAFFGKFLLQSSFSFA